MSLLLLLRCLREFKYVMRDDELALEESLRGVSPFVWGVWKNKGGKSLLELADERGKPKCYTWLALASGKASGGKGGAARRRRREAR